MGIASRNNNRQTMFWSFRRSTGASHDIGLSVIARPAPRTQRPLANLPNPYPYGCSVLCNHPRDPELKDVVWKPRALANDQNADHFENPRATMKNRRHRSGSSCVEGSYGYNNWDQKISNLGPLVEGTHQIPTAKQLLSTIRRCASSGPSHIERRLTRMSSSLVLDLRPWKSFDNVSNINDGQPDGADNLERFELTSPRTGKDKPGRPKSINRRPETFSSRSGYKESKRPLKRSKSKGQISRHSNSVPEGNPYGGYETDELSDSNLHDNDFGNDQGYSSRMKPEDETLYRSMNPVNQDFNVGGSPTNLQPTNDETAIEVPIAVLEELEENLKSIAIDEDLKRPAIPDEELDIINKYNHVVTDDMVWLAFPRAGNTFGARFELPIDLRKLKTMIPLEYLSKHVVATRCRQRLNDVVFNRHATTPSKNLPIEKLMVGLTEILGFRMESAAEEKLTTLAVLNPEIMELNQQEFAGLGALAERIGRQKVSQRDDLEVADFNLLQQKMTYLQMSDNLRQLFLFICKETDD